MRYKILAVLVAATFLLAACKKKTEPADAGTLSPTPAASDESKETAAAPPPSLVLTDLSGNQVEAARNPGKVISLSPAITEILYALDCGGALIGADAESDYPGDVAALQKFSAADIPSIVQAKPEVVFVGRNFSAEARSQLAAAGIGVVMAEGANYDGVYQSIALVAQIMDKDAAELVMGMQEVSQEVYSREFDFEPVSVVLLLSDGQDGNCLVAPAGSLFNNLVGMLGSVSITESVGTGDSMSPEQLQALDPQVVFVSGRLNFEAVISAPAYSGLSAVMEGRVFPVDDSLINRVGPRTVDGLGMLYNMLEQASVS